MFRRAFDKSGEEDEKTQEKSLLHSSLSSHLSHLSKKKNSPQNSQKSLKQPFTTTLTLTLTLTITTVEEFGKKKKSKKKKKLALSDDEEGGGENEEEGKATTSSSGGGVQSGLGLPWDGSDRDYHYDELLGRVFGILKEKNPALSEKTKTIIKPPQIAREGTKKTVFANLMEICNAMHRPHEHVTHT